MNKATKLKIEISRAKRKRKIARLKKELKDIKNPSKAKMVGRVLKNVFKQRGNEDEIFERMMKY